jgi:hypothetical protein
MPGTNNFLQFNPGAANQEVDGAYAADSVRTGGIAFNQTIASLLSNKMFYQWSTMVAALAQMMANKGYNVLDANITALEGVLANLLTSADSLIVASLFGSSSGYIKFGPAFGGLIVQWGLTSAFAPNTTTVINFPVVFTALPAVIVAPPYAGASANISSPMGVLGLGSSSFSVAWNGTGISVLGTYWLAIGK